MSYIPYMEWEVEFTSEFEGWWNSLSEDETSRCERESDPAAETRTKSSAATRRSDSFFAAREHEGTSDSAFGQALSRALCVRPAPLCHSADWWRQDGQ